MRTLRAKNAGKFDNDLLGRLLGLMIIITILIAVAFGIYYYKDRYVHLGDKSTVELAIEQLEDVVAKNPQDRSARLALAQHYYENGEHEKAIQQAETVLKSSPDDPAPLFILGVVYSEAGQIDAAVTNLERLAEIRRGSPMASADRLLETALYYLGANYLKMDQVEPAIKTLSEALEIDGTDADALYQLGLGYSMNGEHERAVEAFQDAVRFVPDFTEAYARMAEAYDALGMSSHAQYARGMVSFSSKEYTKALNELELASQGLPDFVPIYLGLGLIYEQQGDFQKALENLEGVLTLDPDNFNAKVMLERIHFAEGSS